MGGEGSGRQGWWDKKTTVEECKSLDANQWMRESVLRPGVWQSGSVTWFNSATHKKTSTIGYEVNTKTADLWMRLHYTFVDSQEQVDYKIGLQVTRPNFGGFRWWFTCPLVVDGKSCNRRVGKLYLPPGGNYFGCRKCYDLTYTSCQESHKYDLIYAEMGEWIGMDAKTARDLWRTRYPHM